jgi:predicted nucleotidyltransferase
MKTAGNITIFLREVAEWASARGDILAIALVGSHARGQAKADSDIDLILLVEDPEKFCSDKHWPEQFGSVLKRQMEYYGMVTSLRVWYEDGREVEFGFSSREWAEEPLDEGTRRVILEGMRVIFERGTLLSRLLNPPASP